MLIRVEGEEGVEVIVVLVLLSKHELQFFALVLVFHAMIFEGSLCGH